MQEEINKLKIQIEELNTKIELLNNSSTIPHNVEQAFLTRFQLDTYNPLTVSSKSAASESQTVVESGVASYFVLPRPDGYLQVTIGGAVKYIPFFT